MNKHKLEIHKFDFTHDHSTLNISKSYNHKSNMMLNREDNFTINTDDIWLYRDGAASYTKTHPADQALFDPEGLV